MGQKSVAIGQFITRLRTLVANKEKHSVNIEMRLNHELEATFIQLLLILVEIHGTATCCLQDRNSNQMNIALYHQENISYNVRLCHFLLLLPFFAFYCHVITCYLC